MLVYVNWYGQEILSEREYCNRRAEYVNERINDEEAFISWLGDYYTAAEIWEMTPRDREEVRANWLEAMEEGVEDDELNDFEEYEIE